MLSNHLASNYSACLNYCFIFVMMFWKLTCRSYWDPPPKYHNWSRSDAAQPYLKDTSLSNLKSRLSFTIPRMVSFQWDWFIGIEMWILFSNLTFETDYPRNIPRRICTHEKHSIFWTSRYWCETWCCTNFISSCILSSGVYLTVTLLRWKECWKN